MADKLVQGKPLADIRAAVDEHGDVLTLTMEQLRDSYGVARLGVHVVADISRQLKGFGLEHEPQELPLSQWERVRVYRRSSPVGDLIAAVRVPSDAHDELLRKAAGLTIGDDAGAEALRVLSVVRDLVCPPAPKERSE